MWQKSEQSRDKIAQRPSSVVRDDLLRDRFAFKNWIHGIPLGVFFSDRADARDLVIKGKLTVDQGRVDRQEESFRWTSLCGSDRLVNSSAEKSAMPALTMSPLVAWRI